MKNDEHLAGRWLELLDHHTERFPNTFPAIPLPGKAGRWKRSDWQFGGVVGDAEITDWVNHHDSPWFRGSYGYVLANARPLPFIPCRGMLGFFTPAIAQNCLGRLHI